MKVFDAVADFELIEIVSPGLNWTRPTFISGGTKTNTDYVVKVVIAEGGVVEEARSDMESYIKDKFGNGRSIDDWFCRLGNSALPPAFSSQNDPGHQDKPSKILRWMQPVANRILLSEQVPWKGWLGKIWERRQSI